MTADEAFEYFKKTGNIPEEEIKKMTPYFQVVALKKIVNHMGEDASTAALWLISGTTIDSEIIKEACCDLKG